MCWGTPAVIVDIDEEAMIAKVDFGDGIIREALVGISSERVSKGDIVIVHAGVIISKLTREGVLEHIRFLKDVLGEDSGELVNTFQAILHLADAVKGGEGNG